MSFVEQLANVGKFQILECVKDGISYLIICTAKDASRVMNRFQESGHVSINEGAILWQGKGSMPRDLEDALEKAGWGRKEAS